MEKKLQRIPHEGAVAGVCAGLGSYFGIDKTWVRLAFVLSVFFSGYMGIGLLGPIVYIVLWIVLPVKVFSMPQDPFDVDYRTKTDQEFAPYNRYTPNTANRRVSKDRYIAGFILLVVGIFFLLHQLDVFYWRDFARYWPVLIIMMGVASILGAFNSRRSTIRNEQETGPGQEMEQPTDDNGEEHSYTK